jgi:hypothetical protein
VDGIFRINPPTFLRIPVPLVRQSIVAQLEVFCFVDHTQPAAAELRQNAAVRNGFADHRRANRGIFRTLPGLL